MTDIPINPNDLPVDEIPMDEDITYRGTISKVGLGEDRKGRPFMSVSIEVTEPEDCAGLTVNDNYIPFPEFIAPDMPAGKKRQAHNRSVQMGRLVRAAKYTRPFSPSNPPDLEGATVTFKIKNEAFNNRLLPKVDSYLW